MQPPDFDLSKIKFATDKPTFEKAVALYKAEKLPKCVNPDLIGANPVELNAKIP